MRNWEPESSLRQPQKFFEPFSAQRNELGRSVSLSQDTRYTLSQRTTALSTSIQVNYSGEMIAQIHEHSEWVTANHLSISHLTDGRTDGRKYRSKVSIFAIRYCPFAEGTCCLSVCLSVCQSVGYKGMIYHCLFVRRLAECFMDWSMGGGSCVRILRQSQVLCYQMPKHQVD